MWPFEKSKKKKRKYNRKNTSAKIYSKEEKLKLIREYESTGAPITVFCKWYGLGAGTLKNWQERLQKEGESGLEDNRGGKKAQPIAEAVKEEIIRLKIEKPGLGVKKIADYLMRNRFVKVGRDTVDKILKEDPRTLELLQKKRNRWGNSGKEPQRFERSKPGDMYQMDIMTFMLQGLYRIYVIACLDDYSRFIVSIGVFRSQTSERVLDVLKNAIEKYGMPKEVLTDNGRQFSSWRGKSTFQKYLVRSGISHIKSRPYHPQTLGKVESLWRNMYQELLSKEPLSSFEDAQEKIGKWVEWYNFKRPHQGIDGLVPADRFFSVEKSVKEVMEKGSALVKDSLAEDPRKLKEPMYLIGKIGGQEIRVIAKEGSMTLNAMEEVKNTQNNIKGETENGTDTGAGTGNGTAAGADEAGNKTEILQGYTGRGESAGGTDDSDKKEEDKTGNGGIECIQRDNTAMEEQSDNGNGACISEARETWKEAQGLCERGESEGKLSEDKGKRNGIGKEGGRTGNGEEESAGGTVGGQAGDGIL